MPLVVLLLVVVLLVATLEEPERVLVFAVGGASLPLSVLWLLATTLNELERVPLYMVGEIGGRSAWEPRIPTRL